MRLFIAKWGDYCTTVDPVAILGITKTIIYGLGLLPLRLLCRVSLLDNKDNTKGLAEQTDFPPVHVQHWRFSFTNWSEHYHPLFNLKRSNKQKKIINSNASSHPNNALECFRHGDKYFALSFWAVSGGVSTF